MGHNCYAKKEKERILRMGGAIDNGRINGLLEVTRAFGDIQLKKFGVLSKPDLMKFTVDPDQDQVIIIGCDGMFSAGTPMDTVELVTEYVQKEKERADEESEDPNIR